MELYIDVSDFPDYDTTPSTGLRYHTDSKVIDIEYEEYDCKILLDIAYSRYYLPETKFEPKEDDIVITDYSIEIIKIVKNETEIRGKEFKKIEKYLRENIIIL